MRVYLLAFLGVLLLSAPAVVGFDTPAFAGFEEGKAAYDQKDWKTAILNLRPAVSEGDDRAMIVLGNMYSEGLGVEKDPKEAFGLYHKAAEKNNAAGMLATATMYQEGVGVDANGKLAMDWLQRSARLGHQTGAFFYSMALFQGLKGKAYDVKPDRVGAYTWLRIAAKSDVNKEIKDVSNKIADQVAKQLKGEELTAADAAVLAWKPEPPEALGPLPEIAMKKAQDKKAETKPATPAITPAAKP